MAAIVLTVTHGSAVRWVPDALAQAPPRRTSEPSTRIVRKALTVTGSSLGALGGVAEDLVRLAQGLELGGRLRIVGVFVRVHLRNGENTMMRNRCQDLDK